MFGETNHAPYRDLLPQYAAGALDEIMARHVAAHLAGCDACRAELAEWQAITGSLRHELAALPPDDGPLAGWSALRAKLPPHAVLPEQRSPSVSDTSQPFADTPIANASSASVARPAARRWRGLASVAAVVLVAVVSLALFGALRQHNTGANQGTPPSTANTASGCVKSKPSSDTLPHYTFLGRLSMVAPSEGWAGGLQRSDDLSKPFQGVIYHLQQCRWQQYAIALPKIQVESVSMVSPNEGWAVGSRFKTGLHLWVSEEIGLVALHFHDGQWQQVTIPGTQNYVEGVISMHNANDGWLVAIGSGTNPNQLFHYRNGTWSPTTLPASITNNADGDALATVGTNDVWFGTATTPDAQGAFTGTIIHDVDGKVTRYALPANTYPSGLAFTAPTNGWMIGEQGIQDMQGGANIPQPQPIVMHFDGATWSPVSVPSAVSSPAFNNYFQGISLASARTGFITGFNDQFPSTDPLDVYQLASGKWQREHLPLPQDQVQGGGLVSFSVTAVSDNEAWLFVTGHVSKNIGPNTSTNLDKTYIYHFANGVWTLFEQ